MDAFSRFLSVSTEELEISLRGHVAAPWSDFLLNPRRLRGSDFLMRWSQGAWSEKRLIQAVGETARYVAVPYGPSGTAPDNDVRAFELYFERLDKAGLGTIKRPDLLIFSADDRSLVEMTIAELGGVEELPFTSESDRRMRLLISKAVIAVECEKQPLGREADAGLRLNAISSASAGREIGPEENSRSSDGHHQGGRPKAFDGLAGQ